MMKKIWACISIITALVTGAFTYQGGKLLFWYQDRRSGILILVSAAAAGVLFIYSIWQVYRKRKCMAGGIPDIWNVHRRGLVFSNAAFCSAMAGITFYLGKYGNILHTGICIGIIILFAVIITVLMLFSGNKKGLREKEFQTKLKELAPALMEKGLLKYDAVSEAIADEVIGARLDGIKGNNAVGILAVGFIMNMMFLDEEWKMTAVFAVVSILTMLVMTAADVFAARKLNALLNDGHSASVLGFFNQYYAYAAGRRECLMPSVQLDAVVALCDLNAYGEALSLLKTISRKPRMEAYYLQFEIICHEGMRDREELATALGRMDMALQFVKGKSKEKMQEVYDIYSNLCYRRYEEALKIIEKEEGLGNRQKRLRMRLKEDARNRVFGVDEHI